MKITNIVIGKKYKAIISKKRETIIVRVIEIVLSDVGTRKCIIMRDDTGEVMRLKRSPKGIRSILSKGNK